MSDESSPPMRVIALQVYPVKGCAGVDCAEHELAPEGLLGDRCWAVVRGQRVIHWRDAPQLAQVQPRLRHSTVELRAPGMLPLHLSLDSVAAAAPEAVQMASPNAAGPGAQAWDMGPHAAEWISVFLQQPGLRLMRFDPDAARWPHAPWAEGAHRIEAQPHDGPARLEFADHAPLLLMAVGSANASQVGDALRALRPNLLLEGRLDTAFSPTAAGPARAALLSLSAPAADDAGAVLQLVPPPPKLAGRAAPFGVTVALAQVLHGIGRRVAVGARGRLL